MTKEQKEKANKGYKLAVLNVKNFLNGQLETYKSEFAGTGNNKYLSVMNEMHSSFKLVCNMEYEIKRLSKECRRLQEENKTLKNGL